MILQNEYSLITGLLIHGIIFASTFIDIVTTKTKRNKNEKTKISR